ncbi:MAG: 2-phospho-L-lactate transferase [Acidimicrobiales bacterium]
MIAMLCGGFGAARFLEGLRTSAAELCCIVNVGDDFDHLGLRVCPDLDSVLYALAGCFDEVRGWGPVDDSFACNQALARYGQDWFHLGDRDLALSLTRSALLGEGQPLSTATDRLVRAWNIPAAVLPESDQPVRTRIRAPSHWLGFQEFVVRHEARPEVLEIAYEGAAEATPAPGVLTALETADLVVIAPSNPISSIGPILALPGIRRAIATRRRPTVAVSPIVLNAEPRTAAERSRMVLRQVLMEAAGLAHRPSAVAAAYRDLIDAFVLDERDQDEEERPLTQLGLPVLVTDTLAPPGERTELAKTVLEFGAALPKSRSGT